MEISNECWLIGSGYMGKEYAKVLLAQRTPFTCIGRGEKNNSSFHEQTGVLAVTGGLNKALGQYTPPQKAIVAVSIASLKAVTIELLQHGVKEILLEKPGGMNRQEIEEVAQLAQVKNAIVYIAYNRRFYASTIEAEKVIEDDSGVESFSFEFTEWGHTLIASNVPPINLSAWFFSNSSHVVDHAFYLGGFPQYMSCYTEGTLEWYKPARIFSGAGISKTGALFSYQANWTAPGRWGVEVLTRRHRLIFRPMEQLHIQNIGSVTAELVDIDDRLDKMYKPGIYLQTKAFMSGKGIDRLPTVQQQLEHCNFYDSIEQGICESRHM